MKRRLFIVAAATLPLVVAGAAFCQPPDTIPHSGIPPLKAPAVRKAATEAPVDRAAQFAAAVRPPPLPGSTSSPGSYSGAAQPGAYQPGAYDDQHTKSRDERLEIWNSPEMVQARAWVLEYCRRSARTSLREGEEFLAKLSQLPPAEMASWLERFQERRMNIAISRAVEEVARQLMLEQALSRQEAMRQAYANINALRSEAAQAMQQRFLTQQQASNQLGAARGLQRDNAVMTELQQNFDPFELVFDPSSPRGYRRRVAAAMSLPGDLPRSDPRNFIRGEEGVDFGEWANERGAEPPATPVAGAPAAPIAPPAAEAVPAPASGE